MAKKVDNPKPYSRQEREDKREDHRPLLTPLMQELRKRYDHLTYKQVGERSGTTEHLAFTYQRGMQLSPAYVTLTRLITGAGLTPNQAAEMVGLYTPDHEEGTNLLPADADPRLVEIVRFATDPGVPKSVRDNYLLYAAKLAEVVVTTEPTETKRQRRRA